MARSFLGEKEQKQVPGRGNHLNADTEVCLRAVSGTVPGEKVEGLRTPVPLHRATLFILPLRSCSSPGMSFLYTSHVCSL